MGDNTDNKNVIFKKTIGEYQKKYRNRSEHLLVITKKQVEEFDKVHKLEKDYLLKGRKWALIDDKYYEIPKAPRWTWFRNLNAGVQIATCALLAGLVGGGSYLTYALLNPPGIHIVVDGTGSDFAKEVKFEAQEDGSYKGKLEFNSGVYASDVPNENIKVIVDNRTLTYDKEYYFEEISNDNVSDFTLGDSAKYITNKNIIIRPGIVKSSSTIKVELKATDPQLAKIRKLVEEHEKKNPWDSALISKPTVQYYAPICLLYSFNQVDWYDVEFSKVPYSGGNSVFDIVKHEKDTVMDNVYFRVEPYTNRISNVVFSENLQCWNKYPKTYESDFHKNIAVPSTDLNNDKLYFVIDGSVDDKTTAYYYKSNTVSFAS